VHSAATADALCLQASAQHSNLQSNDTTNDNIVNSDVAADVAEVASHTLLSIRSHILHTLPDLAPAVSCTSSSSSSGASSSPVSASSLAAAAAVAAHETAAVAAVCDGVARRWCSYCSAVQSAAVERDAAAVASIASTTEVVEALHSVITVMRTQHAR
jgi:hypothetical protein